MRSKLLNGVSQQHVPSPAKNCTCVRACVLNHPFYYACASADYCTRLRLLFSRVMMELVVTREVSVAFSLP